MLRGPRLPAPLPSLPSPLEEQRTKNREHNPRDTLCCFEYLSIYVLLYLLIYAVLRVLHTFCYTYRSDQTIFTQKINYLRWSWKRLLYHFHIWILCWDEINNVWEQQHKTEFLNRDICKTNFIYYLLLL